MPVPKFVCGVVYASGFAFSMVGDVPWDTRSVVWKVRPNSIRLGKGNLGTHMRVSRKRPFDGMSLLLITIITISVRPSMLSCFVPTVGII